MISLNLHIGCFQIDTSINVQCIVVCLMPLLHVFLALTDTSEPREDRQSPIVKKGTAVAQWLRCCATNRMVAGSIPAGLVGFSLT